jgi:arsenate reductase-like glutaredoxin family protein
MSNNKVEDNNVIIELSEQSPDMASLIAKITSLSLAVETLRNENSHLLQELEDKESLLEDVVVPEQVVNFNI